MTELLLIDFGGGLQIEGPVTAVSPQCYRLDYTPWPACVDDVELWFGDLIEVAPTDVDRHRFIRVIDRGAFEHESYVVGPAFLDSEYFTAFAAALESAGGSWEVPINGWLLTHLPSDVRFNVDEVLMRERVRAYEAGVVDPPPSVDQEGAHS